MVLVSVQPEDNGLTSLNNRIMESDYQKFNMLLGPYMDRIESAMH